MNTIRKAWAWLIASSNDPTKAGIAAKGVAVFGVSLVIQVAPFACQFIHFCIDTSMLQPIPEIVANIITLVLQLVAVILVAFGLLRKIWLGRWAHPDAVAAAVSPTVY